MSCYLQVENLSKSFGSQVLFEGISFGLHEGQRVALVAKNGAGKTTLLRILAGKEEADEGQISFKKDLRVGFLTQNPEFSAQTVFQTCFSFESEVGRLVARYEQLLALQENSPEEFANFSEEFSEILREMDEKQAWNFDSKVKQILGKLGIFDLEKDVEKLSGGEQKRLALAQVLINEPDLLILDEPTNHLDLSMVEWLEEWLSASKMTLLMVTHDRYFLDRVCTEILEIDEQKLFQYRGNYSYYLEKREERLENLRAETKRFGGIFRKELDWMRRQPQARGTKARSRVEAFSEIEKKAKRRIEERRVQLESRGTYIGSKIFEAKYVCKSFGEKPILKDFYYNFSRYERLGIVGKNGTGKTTFLRLLLGETLPDSGSFDIGETVKFGYFDQRGLAFDEQMKVIDVVREVAEYVDLGGGRKLSASQFLTHFLFPMERQQNFVYKLSGGEKRRLYLCTILMRAPNFLVLDEPTNDLDIATLNVLEDYLENFRGCLIVVSHDRFFMDKIVDHLFVFEGEGKVRDFPGNYTDFRLWRESAQEEILKPKKVSQEKKVEKRAKPEQKRKLSFNEQREFESLEKEISELENEKKEIEQFLAQGGGTLAEITERSERFLQVEKELEEKSNRWLELAEFA